MPHPPPRPVLLILVLGTFLAIIGATASGQALIVTADNQTAFLDDTVGSDAATIRAFVNLYLAPSDVEGSALSAERQALLDGQLGRITAPGEVLRIAIVGRDGRVLASNETGLVGRSIGPDTDFDQAVSSRAVQATIADQHAAGGLAPTAPTLLREYLPVVSGDRTYAVVAVWRDAGPILARLDEARLHVVAVTLSAALVVAVLLILIFRAAQGRLTRQQQALLEAARRDPLTGALNHGALVEELSLKLEVARLAGGGLALALLDLDNFGLLDSTHGHAAGDQALRAVADLLGRQAPPTAVWGRYGPDEFLIVADGVDVADLEPAVARLRAALADLSLQFEASERLPVTFSCGICAYPTNGESVTGLLAVAARTLDEARASGGDVTRVASDRADEPDYVRTFDVLQGLIIAVDTKDHYTRRHSEDVARYAEFLAGGLEVDRDTRRALRSAGLLHDVGKIGIPDVVLRKPGPLTRDEFAIVKQHVALGDMIVRDLPELDLVRAGIRHHHERWDGGGYLTGLAGEEIPLIARILAVADAFSAMTTTRPYRKALSVDEALRRLGDAAGTQLEERLVVAFIEGIRSDPHPPLPGDEALLRIWTPYRQVA